LAVSDALRDVDWFLSSFDVLVEDGPDVTRTLAALCREVQVAGRQVHDANIVATMLTHAEGRLLTFNPDDFRRYGDRIALIDPAAGVWASGCAFRSQRCPIDVPTARPPRPCGAGRALLEARDKPAARLWEKRRSEC